MPGTPIPFETFLKVRSANAGTFCPSGRSLAFLMNNSGVAQVYRVDSPTQQPVQLTHTTESVRSIHWSPDGQRLLFAMDEGGSELHQLHLLAPDGSESRLLTPYPGAIHTFGAWGADSRRIAFAANRRDAAHFDLYTLDVDTGEERCVFQRDGHFNVADWSPDGQFLLVRESHAAMDQDLHLLDLESGELRRITPHDGNALYVTPRFLPDSRSVVVCTDQDRDFLALARLDARMLRLRPLLERRSDIESCDVSADGRRVAALLNRDGWTEVVVARLAERTLIRVNSVRLQGVASDCSLSADGARLAISINGPTRNLNVWEMDPETTARVQWTFAPMGELENAALVEPQVVRYPSHDGLEVPALLYRPADAPDGPLPVVVYAHGGPESQDRPNFNPVYQYLVHCGYAVLAPNVRGSTGYGNAYCHLDDVEKRYDALRDVEHAYHWLVSSGTGDPELIALMGASYGGFTVLACLTRQPELWAAGVDIVGIANFETFFQNTGAWRRALRASESGNPERDAELLRDLSPIHAVDQIQAPLLVVQGANDPRVPQGESDQMVARLRERGHPVEYLLFPDEGHGIVKLANRVTAYTAVGAFLDRYLSGEGAASLQAAAE